MIVTVYPNYTTKVSDPVIGVVGDHGIKTIDISFPRVPGATNYLLRFGYPGAEVYEVDVSSGTYTVDGSICAKNGAVDCQWLAVKYDGGAYTLIAKSEMFTGHVRPSVGGEVLPIPPFEASEAKFLELLEYTAAISVWEPYDPARAYKVGNKVIYDGSSYIYHTDAPAGILPTDTAYTYLLAAPVSKGDKGDDGKSAYQIAVENGFEGTETEWLLSLIGAPGEKGETGESGVTPHIGENNNWWLGDTDTGIPAIGAPGADGKDGKDGITPVRGVDYWTDADQSAIIAAVLDSLPSADGEVY